MIVYGEKNGEIMNIQLVLEKTKFTDLEKIKIGSFITPLINNMSILSIEYLDQNDYEMITICLYDIIYYFGKSNINKLLTLSSYERSKEVYTEYQFFSSFVPTIVYKFYEGKSLGMGDGQRERKRSVLYNTAYVDSMIKVDIGYAGGSDKPKSITVYVQKNSLVKSGTGFTFDLVNYYFTINMKSKEVMETHPHGAKRYNMLFSDKQYKNHTKYKYSNELAENFLGCFNSLRDVQDVYSEVGREGIKNFVYLTKMILI